jgi:hypothetical protein
MLRLGLVRGQQGYKARYDVNNDGVIDARDLAQVARMRTCEHEEDGQDGDRDHHRGRDLRGGAGDRD